MDEVPNRLNVVRQQLPAGQLADFRDRSKVTAKYRVAARLWANHNIVWSQAIEIAESAFGNT